MLTGSSERRRGPRALLALSLNADSEPGTAARLSISGAPPLAPRFALRLSTRLCLSRRRPA